MKSSTVVSDRRIERNPKASVIASGTANFVCAKINTDTSRETHIIAKSLSDHNQRLASAFRFCGYK